MGCETVPLRLFSGGIVQPPLQDFGSRGGLSGRPKSFRLNVELPVGHFAACVASDDDRFYDGRFSRTDATISVCDSHAFMQTHIPATHTSDSLQGG